MDTPQIRQLDLAGQLGRGPAGTPAAWPALVGQVVTSAPAVGTYCRVNVVSVLGAETEGGVAATSVSSGATLAVFLVGPHAPFTGDMLVCRFVGHRWVAESGGAGGGTGQYLSGCPCRNIPSTLYLHVASQPTDPMLRSYAHPATLTYGPRPADLASYNVEGMGYFSEIVETWGPVFGVNTVLDQYRYHFGCDSESGYYYIQGLMVPTSPLDYPNVFAMVLWEVGGPYPGNTCSPFSLTQGGFYNDGLSIFSQQGITLDGSGPYG